METERTDFWQPKSIEDLARQQNVAPITSPDQIIGKGDELWESDDEFTQFIEGIRDRRHDTVARP